MHGTFFVLEGTDSSGKSTQLDMLAERLVQAGYDVVAISFPQYNKPSSFFVREYLAGSYGSTNDVGPYTASVFYALDRFATKDAVEAALSEGKVVLANRYAGSNMAHQGTKFSYSEERRGFFLWLDNLEFQMLKLPRPTMSFVLRVDSETTLKMQEQRRQEKPSRIEDIHEKDHEHIKRSVDVYDDLCTLFPKDFTRIDCVRAGKLLKPEHIHELLWQTVSCQLPKPPGTSGTLLDLTSEPIHETPVTSDGEDGRKYGAFTLKDISYLAYSKLLKYDFHELTEEPFRLRSESGEYQYYTPSHFDPTLTKQYREINDAIFSTYASMERTLSESIAKTDRLTATEARNQAHVHLRSVLPLSTLTTASFWATTELIESAVIDLLSQLYPELQNIGQELFMQAQRSGMQLFAQGTSIDTRADLIAKLAKSRLSIAKLAEDMLPATHTPRPDPVTLVSYWPHNEFELIPDILYEHSNMGLRDIRKSIDTWTYDEKENLISSALFHCRDTDLANTVLSMARYTYDIVCSLISYQEILSLDNHVSPKSQMLTPRYGFETPEEILNADLVDQYEDCFDLSLKLHGVLLSTNNTEAQYAILLGSKVRVLLTINGADLVRLSERGTHDHMAGTEAPKILIKLVQYAAEKNPLLIRAGLSDDGSTPVNI